MRPQALRWQAGLRWLCLALPWASLAWAALAWLRWGSDMPWFDDWRAYADGSIGRWDWRGWFRPVNDTLAPLGFALDELAQRALGGNSLPYQFLSMLAVQGSLLALQGVLLRRFLGDTLRAALCFAATLPMLQPGSYWGLENMAYHQALPLVFLLLALRWMLACPQPRAWHGPAVGLMGLLAGASYISGAFGTLALAVALIVYGWLARRQGHDTRWLRHTGWLGLAGLAWVLLQLGLAVWAARSRGGAPAGIPMAFPQEADFWLFYLGKLGRALMLSPAWGGLALGLTGLAAAAVLVLAWRLGRRSLAPAATPAEQCVAALLWALGAMVFVYLGLVAAGRTHFRPPEVVAPLDVFAYGFLRFHFFWATLLWPWVLAALWLVAARAEGAEGGRPRPSRWTWAVGGAAVLALLGWTAAGAWRHSAGFAAIAAQRQPVENCLRAGLQAGAPIHCLGLLPSRFDDPAPDAWPAYLHARAIGAAFVRSFPILGGTGRPQGLSPAWTWEGGSEGAASQSQLESLWAGAYRATGADPQWTFDLPPGTDWRRCQQLEVELALVPRQDGRVLSQVFFLRTGQASYAETAVASQAWVARPGVPQTLYFTLESPLGFVPALRVDPVDRPQDFALGHLRAYCRVGAVGG